MSPGYTLFVLTLCTAEEVVVNRLIEAYWKPLSSVAQSFQAQTVLPTTYRPAEVGAPGLRASVQLRALWPLDSRYSVTVRPTSTNRSEVLTATASTLPCTRRTRRTAPLGLAS